MNYSMSVQVPSVVMNERIGCSYMDSKLVSWLIAKPVHSHFKVVDKQS